MTIERGLTESRSFIRYSMRPRVEILRIRSALRGMFKSELPYEEKQTIVNQVNHSDFIFFRDKFMTFTDIYGRRQAGGIRTGRAFLALEEFLKTKEMTVGKFRTSTGYTRFILTDDLEKARTLLRDLKVRRSVSRVNPSETPGPAS